MLRKMKKKVVASAGKGDVVELSVSDPGPWEGTS